MEAAHICAAARDGPGAGLVPVVDLGVGQVLVLGLSDRAEGLSTGSPITSSSRGYQVFL